MKDKSI